MPNLSSKEIQDLQKKAADLEAKLIEKEMAVVIHLNEKEALATALQESEQQRQEAEQQRQEAEQQRQEAEAKRQSAEAELESVSAKLQKKERDYDLLVQKHMAAQRNQFGQKSERFVDESNLQMPLFPTEFDGNNPEPKPEDIETITYKRPKGGKRRPLDMSGFPHREVVLPVDEKERVCACCGHDKKTVGYDSSSRLHVIPAQFEVVIEKREKMACPYGCEGQFTTAALPLRVLPKSIASESLLAYIFVSKVLDRQPLYHLEKVMEQRHNWKIGRNTMARWLIMVADQLQPFINLMKDQIEGYDVAAIDATSFHVLNEPGRKPQTKSYAYCIRGGPPDKRVILYEYNAYAHKDYVDETLSNFKGFLHCDASTVFNKVAAKETVTLSYCHAHARRKFEQIEKAAKKGKAPLASEALRIYRQLYEVERHATEQALSPDQRLALRQAKSRPILDEFYRWLLTHRDRTLPKSPIGQAIAYCLSHWDGLLTYLNDGRIDIDNNATERDIKPFVMARKNFLFACTPQGADSLGVHFSLILTARLHGLDPIAYYTKILKRLPYCISIHDYEALLPWKYRSLL
jgi:transposase